MPILDALEALYRSRGHEILNGLPPEFSSLPYTEFTYVVSREQRTSGALGIAPSEIFVLEHVFRDWHPRTILVIGNSFGWSTLALALLNPRARVIALDAALDNFTRAWVDETNALAQAASLNVLAVAGSSPQDVPATLLNDGVDTLDFVFVDGHHSNDQLVEDYTATVPFSSAGTVWLFHDVEYWDLREGVETVRTRGNLQAHRLLRTASGMAALLRDDARPEVAAALRPFELGVRSRPLLAALYADDDLDRPLPSEAAPADADWLRDAARAGNGRTAHLRRELAQLRNDFAVILEDRRSAQLIMEHQQREIDTLRSRS